MSDIKHRKAAFRIAFDYFERQLDNMPAYASTERFWAQAWADLLKSGENADVLTQELLATVYWELERIWLADYKVSDSV